MKDIKKYMIWFVVWILSVWTITYAADNGSIWALFEQLVTGEWVLVGNNIKDGSVWSWKLIDNSITSNISSWNAVWNTCDWIACVSYCLNSNSDIVWMKWITNSWNYDECFTNESGSLINVIKYYK